MAGSTTAIGSSTASASSTGTPETCAITRSPVADDSHVADVERVLDVLCVDVLVRERLDDRDDGHDDLLGLLDRAPAGVVQPDHLARPRQRVRRPRVVRAARLDVAVTRVPEASAVPEDVVRAD